MLDQLLTTLIPNPLSLLISGALSSLGLYHLPPSPSTLVYPFFIYFPSSSLTVILHIFFSVNAAPFALLFVSVSPLKHSTRSPTTSFLYPSFFPFSFRFLGHSLFRLSCHTFLSYLSVGLTPSPLPFFILSLHNFFCFDYESTSSVHHRPVSLFS